MGAVGLSGCGLRLEGCHALQDRFRTIPAPPRGENRIVSRGSAQRRCVVSRGLGFDDIHFFLILGFGLFPTCLVSHGSTVYVKTFSNNETLHAWKGTDLKYFLISHPSNTIRQGTEDLQPSKLHTSKLFFRSRFHADGTKR